MERPHCCGRSASEKGVACLAGPPCKFILTTRPSRAVMLGCSMNYPKVSFERKAIVTLKTFSSRNALPGHAARAVSEKTKVCVMPVDWGPDPWRWGSARRAKHAGCDDFDGASGRAESAHFLSYERNRPVDCARSYATDMCRG